MIKEEIPLISTLHHSNTPVLRAAFLKAGPIFSELAQQRKLFINTGSSCKTVVSCF
jgi:hypothetical protein